MMNRSNYKTIYEILGRDSVHPFPARMAPGIALDVVADCREALRVLDPMSGSGTVLAVARAKGHYAIGVDIDPLSVLISKVWTSPIDTTDLQETATEVLELARRTFASLCSGDAYPKNSDEETRQFVRFWFDDCGQRQLASLATAIEGVRDNTIRDALWCAFSRLIISKQSGASLAMDLSHSRPHKAFQQAPSKPFSKFLFSVERVANNCIDNSLSNPGPIACVQRGDARSLPIDDSSIDLVLTSPPYLNAIDYLRCSKFSLVWMGYSIREVRQLRSTIVGTEVGKGADDNNDIRSILLQLNLRPKLQRRWESILVRYIDDMWRAVGETARVLTEGGKAVYVVGENTVRGTFIPNSLIVEEIANRVGLRCIARRSRDLPANRRYLPPPSAQPQPAALDGRIRREIVLTFKKVA